MFKRLPSTDRPTVTIHIEGQAVQAAAGDTVAAAMFAAGYDSVRTTPVSQTPRGPFCLMGACFDCLAEIDGVPNRQACMTQVADGMRVRRQEGARPAVAREDTEWSIPQT